MDNNIKQALETLLTNTDFQEYVAEYRQRFGIWCEGVWGACVRKGYDYFHER